MAEFLFSNNYSDLFYRYTSNIMYTLAYGDVRNTNGYAIDDLNHKRLHEINEMATFILRQASHGTILLDVFPFLDTIPLDVCMSWRKTAQELHVRTKKAYIECAEKALKIENGWNWSIQLRQRMQEEDGFGLAWEDVCYSLGELYVAGIHTTKLVLENFVQTCIENPESMKKAQSELDSFVGADRLPSFIDLDRLPYVNSLISELLRRRPISPLGVPHMVIQDDVYMEYRIPAGTVIIANQMEMNMDDSIFQDPERFDPDRYMRNPSLPEPVTFGFGRRQCPGYRIAKSNLFIIISRILWGLEITPVSTKEYDMKKAMFSVRSKGHRDTIIRMVAECWK